MASVSSAQSRKNNTDARIADATLELLRSGGPSAVSVEAVSARSGVAKTTIYRRHADRLELLEAVLDSVVPRIETSDPAGAATSDTPRAQLLALLRSACDIIQHRVGVSMVTAILSTHQDPGNQMILDRIIDPRVANFTTWFSRWQAAGVLRAELDAELAVMTVFGTTILTYARRGEIPDGWPEKVVDHLWPLFGAVDDDREHA